MKYCKHCEGEFPLDSDHWYVQKNSRVCLKNKKESAKKWQDENVERRRQIQSNFKANNPDYHKVYHLKHTYGLSVDEYNNLLVQQSGRCAICFTDEWGGRRGKPHVDHDHETGEVRGLLCNRCNMGLGYFLDDPQSLLNAIGYLRAA